MGKGGEIGLVFGAMGVVNAVGHIIAVRVLFILFVFLRG